MAKFCRPNVVKLKAVGSYKLTHQLRRHVPSWSALALYVAIGSDFDFLLTKILGGSKSWYDSRGSRHPPMGCIPRSELQLPVLKTHTNQPAGS